MEALVNSEVFILCMWRRPKSVSISCHSCQPLVHLIRTRRAELACSSAYAFVAYGQYLTLAPANLHTSGGLDCEVIARQGEYFFLHV
jgi:hypothetical protein